MTIFNPTGYVPNFTMTGGNLPVPYSAPGLPTAPPPGTGFQMLGNPQYGGLTPYQTPGLPGSYPSPALIPDATAVGEPAAVAAQRLSLLRALGPAALAAGVAAYADPVDTTGTLNRGKEKGSISDLAVGSLGADDPNDLGITSIGKSLLRGGNYIADKVSDTLGAPMSYLTSTKAERDSKAKVLPPIDIKADAQTEHGDGASPEYVIPGGAPRGSGSELDTLMAVLGALKPKQQEVPKEMKDQELFNTLMSAGAQTGSTKREARGKLWQVLGQGNLAQQQQDLALKANYAKQTADWLKEYAKTGVDVAKEKNAETKDDFKIHTTKNGFLVEMNQGGNKVLKPISANIFGAAPGTKMGVMGHKFDSSNPLHTELTLLQNLGDVGILNDVLVEHNKELMKATKGLSDPKQMQEAQILTLARAVHQNPAFGASLRQRYLDQMGKAPSASPRSETDFLEALSPSEPAQ